MSNRTNFYINGEWVAPSTSDTIDVINPATEQSIGQVAMGGAADVDKAVAAAKAAEFAQGCDWRASVALPRARLWIAKFEARQRRERRRRAAV